MSSRFLQKDFLKCGNCTFMHRYARGYRPIPNPILFKSDVHCRSFSDEQRMSAGYSGMRLSTKCPSCEKLHSKWTWMDFQTFLDEKEKLPLSEQRKYLLSSNPLKQQAIAEGSTSTRTVAAVQ
ncbi:Hypothetical protein, putative [Bodo saltans]|uniref:Uncharacterized protein n=1 Tax=Bodo saltans TaxID=75058 RepID=B6DTF0_BODSA|nr:hypothetical protein [Bodo saltans]CUG88463.1 Hypothetical protein, putative [Bodo saltans]|eukprot:CUG88463.1 Hypothetical protein, putative [Bodo saltans]